MLSEKLIEKRKKSAIAFRKEPPFPICLFSDNSAEFCPSQKCNIFFQFKALHDFKFFIFLQRVDCSPDFCIINS